MDFSIKFDTIKPGWSIEYTEGSKVITYFFLFLSLKTIFVLANSADPDVMLHPVVFHVGLHCLPKYVYVYPDYIVLIYMKFVPLKLSNIGSQYQSAKSYFCQSQSQGKVIKCKVRLCQPFYCFLAKSLTKLALI